MTVFLLKILLFLLLFVPALILTFFIWLLGGWTQGFDYMPNPLYALFEWIDN